MKGVHEKPVERFNGTTKYKYNLCGILLFYFSRNVNIYFSH